MHCEKETGPEDQGKTQSRKTKRKKMFMCPNALGPIFLLDKDF